jgi:hypothetical protein
LTPTLEIHDGVRLRREIDGFPAGTEGDRPGLS